MSREESKKPLKVTDRRMFTADGELREPGDGRDDRKIEVSVPKSETGPDRAPPSEPAVTTPETEPETTQGFQGQLPEPGFADLVSILAEPIALFLGDVSLPDGRSAENLDLARFHIDLLEVLKRKTDSNLSQEESAVLDDLLYRLRMRYVQKSG